MIKYEYKTILDQSLMYSNEMNEYGNEGWELCALWRDKVGNFVYYFKRVIE
jgi:hypothetical protein